MGEFNIGKLIKFMIIGFILITVLRACTVSTFGGYGPGGHYYGPGMGGGGGFFTGMLLGNMMGGGGSIFSGGNDRNVRRGSMGSSTGSRGGGFGFGK